MCEFWFVLLSAKGGQYRTKGSFTTTTGDVGVKTVHQKKPGLPISSYILLLLPAEGHGYV